jgi:predicted secreted hydrolase
LSVESLGIEFDVLPLVADQELATRQSTDITYWEGLVEGSGISQGKAVTIEGYVELTGYAGSLAEVF